MDFPHVTVHPGPKADHHAKLRATLEQKTLAILSAKGGAIDAAVRNVILYAETLDAVGAIDGDDRRDYTRTAMEYGQGRQQHLENEDVEDALSIFGIFFILVALMIAICVPTHLGIIKAINPWDKDMDIMAEFAPLLRSSGWLTLVGCFFILTGSGYRSALAMVCRWKYTIAVSMTITYAFMVFGLSWPVIQYHL